MRRLPKHLQAILEAAIARVNAWVLHAFEAQNGAYLAEIVEYGTDVRTLPTALLDGLRPIAEEVVAELANANAMAREIHDSYAAFAKTYGTWVDLSEGAYQSLLRL